MGLYLCVFDPETEDEVEGVEVGLYADFGEFRDIVAAKVEGGVRGRRFPVLQNHADSDGEWSCQDCMALRSELIELEHRLKLLPPIALHGWKLDVQKLLGLATATLYDCFFDVDGEPLVERLLVLCKCSLRTNSPILFQ